MIDFLGRKLNDFFMAGRHPEFLPDASPVSTSRFAWGYKNFQIEEETFDEFGDRSDSEFLYH